MCTPLLYWNDKDIDYIYSQFLIILTIFWVRKGCFNKHGCKNLIKSVKSATLCLLKINVIWNKVYNPIYLQNSCP